ncbi:MAG: HAD hydrolase-like protein [Candidatus Aenigmatarchaeota archaeon]|nr:HAD hydrolase-like protein [Candidatus Aenigmarchaeota archaeon]
MLKWVVYDLGGTIVNLDNSEQKAMQIVVELLKNMGYSISVDDIKKSKIAASEKLEKLKSAHVEKWKLFLTVLENMNINIKKDDAIKLSNIYDDVYVRFSTLLPNAESILNETRRRGFKVALLSDGWNKTCRGILRYLDIENYFDVIFTSEDFGKRKLEGLFSDFCVAVRCKPKDCLVIGNDEKKDGISQSIGMHFCCIGGNGEFSVSKLNEITNVLDYFDSNVKLKCFFCGVQTDNSIFCNNCKTKAIETVKKSNEETGLYTDICKYYGRDVIEEVLQGPINLRKEWLDQNPVTEKEILNFYRTNKNEIFDLTLFHSAPHVIQQDKRIEKIIKNKGGTFLDFGAGIGHLTVNIGKTGIKTFHADLDGNTRNYAIWRAREKDSDVNFIDVKLDNTKYDSIACTDVIEHHPDPSKLIRYLSRRLKRGGIFLINEKFQRKNNIDILHPMHLMSSSNISLIELIRQIKMLKLVERFGRNFFVLQKL